VGKESPSERKSLGNFALNDLESWNRIFFGKDEFEFRELPPNISLVRESFGEVTIDKFRHNKTDEQLTYIRINRECKPERIIVCKRKSGTFKINQGNYFTSYFFSEDGEIFTPIDRQTFSHLLKKDISLTEVRKRAESENPQHIFFTENLWRSLNMGKIPDKFIGRITVDEWEDIQACGFNYCDSATKDVVRAETDIAGSSLSLSTDVGTYLTTPLGDNHNTKYFFIPPSTDFSRPDKIQLSQVQFFEALKNQQPPLT